MKIVFMGTPEFARVPLVCLAESKHQLLAVVTGPDKPFGRGRKLVSTPCKQEADYRNIPVLTPKSLKSEILHQQLAEYQPDLFVVVAFRILPESLFTLPKLGSINIHGSLLPKYRGAAPINWALINGDNETGLTSFFLKNRVDTGDMIARVKIPIDPMDSYDSLSEKMSKAAGPFLLRTLDLIAAGQTEPTAQDETLATPARKLEPRDGLIDFDRPALAVHNQIRGMTSRPGAFSGFRGKVVKIKQTRPIWADESLNDQALTPGEIIPQRKQLLVKCAEETLEVLSLVPEGRKPMDGRSFINGFQPQKGEKFVYQNS